MQDQFTRTELLLGKESTEKLAASRVAVFGVGGVGGYVVEALARSGVGAIDLIDNDTVSITNLNRQLYATHSTVGKYKVDVAAERILDINPNAKVRIYRTFYTPQTEDQFDFTEYDYVVDAIDTVAGKIAIVVNADKANTPVISSMGAGNKLDPTAFEVADIYRTSVCPLARVMRYELRRRGIKKLKVVYSKEMPVTYADDVDDESIEAPEGARRRVPGSNAFVPSVAGLIIAGEVVCDLIGVKNRA